MTEEEMLAKRMTELAQRSFHSGQYAFTDFLSMAQQDVYYRMERELAYASPAMWGGTKDCERRMLGFGSEETCGYEQPFPIDCLQIVPLSEKFGEELSHRDYLGALMNLGIERDLLGDIVVGEKSAFLFCAQRIAPYLVGELTQVRHTRVQCAYAQNIPETVIVQKTPRSFTVASQRCDSIVAGVWKLSRSRAQELFRQKKVFVDGRLVEQHSTGLSAGSSVSVRGYGKFRYLGCSRETKKGKLAVDVEVYGGG